MELATVLFCITFHVVLVLSLIVDLPGCTNCSNRPDVPCRIQLLHRVCIHNEFDGDTWPGQPKALTGREVKMNGTSVANFTWKVPYDASYRALDGFFLYIMMVEKSVIGSECFFANLSGTDWKTVVDPYSVVFHFDCVRSDQQLDVELTLKSSPVPLHTSNNISVKSSLSFQADIDWSSFTVCVIVGAPVTEQNISINVEVKDYTVNITFGPTKPYMEHDVCLMKYDASISYVAFNCLMRQIVNRGENSAVFRNVPVGQYKVMVQIDDVLFKSKAFNVTAKKPVELSFGHLTILSITMACLVVVTGTTTLCFCILRKRGHCLSLGRQMCNCYSMYQRGTYVPNNAAGDEEARSMEVLPLFYPESELFQQAVQKCCLYLSKWSKCKINFDWMNENNPTMLCEKNSNRPYIVLVFLSSKMLKFLDEMILKSSSVQHTDYQTQIFQSIYENAFKKIVVGLQPLTETSLHLKDRLELTKYFSHLNHLEVNTQALNELISMIKVENIIENGWCSHGELSQVLNVIKQIPPKDLNMPWNQSNKETLVDIKRTSPNTGFFHSEGQNDSVPYHAFREGTDGLHGCPTQKELQTYKWAQSVNQCSMLPCPNNCLNSLNQNNTNFFIGYYSDRYNPDDIEPDESASVYHGGNLDVGEVNHMPCDQDYNELPRLDGNHGHHPPYDSALPTPNWEPPEWDSESVSYSMIGQRQAEIYNNYRASCGDTKL